jgi:hypothetical protein
MRKKCCVGSEEMQDMLLEYQIQNDVFYTQKKEPHFSSPLIFLFSIGTRSDT